MPDELGKTLGEHGKSDIHPLMTALLGKLLYSCFLFDLATGSFVLFGRGFPQLRYAKLFQPYADYP